MKIRLIFLTVFLFLTVALIILKLGVNTSQGDNMVELKLILSLDKTIYQPNEAVSALISLKNVGNKDLVVNRRMTVNFSAAPNKFRDISFTITGPSGETVPFAARINARPPTEKDFVSLSPGETIETTINIQRLHHMTDIGPYSVSAVYQNVMDPTSFPLHKSAWKGEITSNVVVFEIVP